MKILETQDSNFNNINAINYADFNLQIGNILEQHSHTVSLEYQELRVGSKLDNQLSSFYKHGFLPESLNFNGFSLRTLKDQSQYLCLEKDTSVSHFVKFRRVRTSDSFFDFIGNTAEIVSLVCLFSTNGIRARLFNNLLLPFNQFKFNRTGKIESIVVDNSLTHYEIESIYRQVSFINELMEQNSFYKTVRLQLPLVQYYIFGLEEYERSFLSSELLLQYFDIIDERVDRLTKIYKNRIKGNIKLDIPLLAIKDYIRDTVKSNQIPSLEFALEILSKDDLRKYAIDFIKPTTWYSLGTEISEAIEEMRPSFEDNGKVSVVIKNPKEEVTMTIVKRVSKYIYDQVGKHTHLLGMYPHEQVLINHSDVMRKKRLYDIPQKPTFSNVKKIRNHYGYK